MMVYIKKLMLNIMLPLGIIFTFQLLGNLINKYLINFLPGPIIGMLLLLTALIFNIVPYKIIEVFTAFLVKHISFFLIPTNISLIIIVPKIQNYFIRIILMLVISLISVIIVTGTFANWYNKKTIKGDADE